MSRAEHAGRSYVVTGAGNGIGAAPAALLVALGGSPAASYVTAQVLDVNGGEEHL